MASWELPTLLDLEVTAALVSGSKAAVAGVSVAQAVAGVLVV